MPTEFSASTLLRKKASRASVDVAGEGAALTRVVSGRSEATSGPESPSPEGGLSPDLSLVDKESGYFAEGDDDEGEGDKEANEGEGTRKADVVVDKALGMVGGMVKGKGPVSASTSDASSESKQDKDSA